MVRDLGQQPTTWMGTGCCSTVYRAPCGGGAEKRNLLARISVVLHTAIAEQVVNELACGGGGRVHGAKCLATLAGVA